MAELKAVGYSFPSTSDKGDDETWVASSDRKRHFLEVEREETEPGDGLLPTRPAT
jgi:hypothetical protein